jgi:ketosteroid isomerase-like protein
LTADAVVRLIGGFADLLGQEFRGRDAALAVFKDWMGALDARGEIETIREADDRVVVIFNLVGSGAASGAPTAMRTGWVGSVRDGGISAIDAYYSVEEAFQAVGLSE